MSTRCNIIITGYARESKIYLYHHSDGYPSGVGADLAEFLNENVCKKHEKWYSEGIATKLVKRADARYECSMGLHSDIEYLYVIDCFAGKLECYAVDWEEVGGIDTPINEYLVCKKENLRPIPGWDCEKEAEDGR